MTIAPAGEIYFHERMGRFMRREPNGQQVMVFGEGDRTQLRAVAELACRACRSQLAHSEAYHEAEITAAERRR